MKTDLVAGKLVRLAPCVCRLVAPNSGMMTGPGTNTYIIGEKETAVIDPGPAIDSHIETPIIRRLRPVSQKRPERNSWGDQLPMASTRIRLSYRTAF
jgi:hypothetical protein